MGGSIYSKTQVSGEVLFFFPRKFSLIHSDCRPSNGTNDGRKSSEVMYICVAVFTLCGFLDVLNTKYTLLPRKWKNICGTMTSLMAPSSVSVSPVF